MRFICECSPNNSYKGQTRCPKCGAFGVEAETFRSESLEAGGNRSPKTMESSKPAPSSSKKVYTERDMRQNALDGEKEK
jgi:predicted ATP-dependent serine protease